MQYFPLDLTQQQTVTLFNNRLYFGNKHDYLVVFPTWFAYISLSILFLMTINENIINEISLGLGIFSYVFSLPGIYFAIKCFGTDPGILKRGNLQPPSESAENDIHHPIAQDIGLLESNKETVEELKEFEKSNAAQGEKQSKQNETDDSENSQNSRNQAQDQESNQSNKQKDEQIMEAIRQIEQQNVQNNKVRGNLFQQRYCNTCKIMRPPLSSHCGHCNNCVKNFDHHCYFMGNCIGERNQKYFVLFLLSTLIWSIYVEVFTIIETIFAFQDNSYIFLDMIHNPYLIYPFIFFSALTVVTAVIRCHNCIRQWIFVGFVLQILIIIGDSYYNNMDVPFADNPLICLVMIGAYLGVILFVLPQASLNLSLACRNLTLKQESYIVSYQSSEHNASNPSFSNFWKLITRPKIKSEILN
ncbi:DHHC zinc finger protein (macronuclear) [Tetrahymena thermophila SB210]|uniref:Palmitoyltransferase n=1 Tax=Tetrahymena thermophila (strain SB210) TaxID=312017 RepID=Q23KH6_TETTS|nr:DHHC zinc finger protein [Tetrahymena thermophila SB210]EAR96867.1 DHHC zinc finger protein [Tetrahymena thermophila SB210]|eukprot:XP_001017112.1 DHHC zinc finger protein [Tetrahymena thermophila SB210]